jgi:hypothetical protein
MPLTRYGSTMLPSLGKHPILVTKQNTYNWYTRDDPAFSAANCQERGYEDTDIRACEVEAEYLLTCLRETGL